MTLSLSRSHALSLRVLTSKKDQMVAVNSCCSNKHWRPQGPDGLAAAFYTRTHKHSLTHTARTGNGGHKAPMGFYTRTHKHSLSHTLSLFLSLYLASSLSLSLSL